MEAAITRRDREGVLIAPDEGIGFADALKGYTHSAARISDLPQLGSIEPGKLADLIILDRDPLTTPPDRLIDIKIDKTYIGGACVWSR